SMSGYGELERVVSLVVLRARNPYQAGPPITDKRLFFGREILVQGLRTELLGSSVLLVGPWRIGKSSILRRILAEPPSDFHPVLVDMQRFAGASDYLLYQSCVITPLLVGRRREPRRRSRSRPNRTAAARGPGRRRGPPGRHRPRSPWRRGSRRPALRPGGGPPRTGAQPGSAPGCTAAGRSAAGRRP